MVSETVFDLTHKHLSFGYDFAGEQKVKGQDKPIVGYRVRMPGSNSARQPDAAISVESQEAKNTAQAFGNTRASAFADAPPAEPATRFDELRNWYLSQPKRARPGRHDRPLCGDQPAHIGLPEIWFIYPSIPFAVFLLIYFLV